MARPTRNAQTYLGSLPPSFACYAPLSSSACDALSLHLIIISRSSTGSSASNKASEGAGAEGRISELPVDEGHPILKRQGKKTNSADTKASTKNKTLMGEQVVAIFPHFSSFFIAHLSPRPAVQAPLLDGPCRCQPWQVSAFTHHSRLAAPKLC